MREPSYMIVLPMNEKDIDEPDILLDNLSANEHITIVDTKFDDEQGVIVDLKVDGKPYQMIMMPTDIEVPDMFRPQHDLTEEEYQKIDETTVGLGVYMDFDDDNAQCFYDQLRMIDAMFPEVLAVLDCASEKLLSGRWVSLAARSSTLPSPRYLFTVQAINDGGDEVWLHTHGMKRCGMFELEVLCSTRAMCNDHYKVIEAFAYHMLESEDGIEPGDAVFVARAGESYIVCTAVDWKEALKFYPDAMLGAEADREDDVHSEDTCVLMVYKCPDDEENRKYSLLQDYDDELEDNPMFMLSGSETARMKSLAIERIPFMKKGFENKDNTVILKIGLTIDEQYWDDDGKPQKEHIWFELKDIKDGCVVAELTQDPYYVSGMKKGDTGTYLFEDITDWMIFTQKGTITPDDVYKL